MSQQCERLKTFTATEALAVYRRVKLTADSGTAVEYADAGADFLGITQEAAAITKQVTVDFVPNSGTNKCTASGAISVGAAVYGAADGKISATPAGVVLGFALEAALADDDIIECRFATNSGEQWS
jgi:hypothetical protein